MLATLGTKIMPIGHSFAICCASCPAPLGSFITDDTFAMSARG
jgi:hypothetical protein